MCLPYGLFTGGMTGGRRLLCSILHSSDFDSSAYEFSKQVYILGCTISVSLFYLCSIETFADWLFRLQEAILTTPRGITRLMDMLMDREVNNYYISWICTILLLICSRV